MSSPPSVNSSKPNTWQNPGDISGEIAPPRNEHSTVQAIFKYSDDRYEDNWKPSWSEPDISTVTYKAVTDVACELAPEPIYVEQRKDDDVPANEVFLTRLPADHGQAIVLVDAEDIQCRSDLEAVVAMCAEDRLYRSEAAVTFAEPLIAGTAVISYQADGGVVITHVPGRIAQHAAGYHFLSLSDDIRNASFGKLQAPSDLTLDRQALVGYFWTHHNALLDNPFVRKDDVTASNRPIKFELGSRKTLQSAVRTLVYAWMLSSDNVYDDDVVLEFDAVNPFHQPTGLNETSADDLCGAPKALFAALAKAFEENRFHGSIMQRSGDDDDANGDRRADYVRFARILKIGIPAIASSAHQRIAAAAKYPPAARAWLSDRQFPAVDIDAICGEDQ